MKALWYWEAIFQSPDDKFFEIKGTVGFETQQDAIDDLTEKTRDGTVVCAGVPEGSTLLDATAVLENKRVC